MSNEHDFTSNEEKPDSADGRRRILVDDAHLPITISIDVDSLLKTELGWQDEIDPEEGPIGRYPGGNGRIIDAVVNVLAIRLHDSVGDVVRQAVLHSAVRKVDALIDEVLAGEITLTSQYGEKRGKPVPMREAMMAAMIDRLEQAVDSNGNRIDRNSYGNRYTLIDWYAEKAARDVLDKDLNARVGAVVSQIRDKAKKMVSDKIAAALGQAVR